MLIKVHPSEGKKDGFAALLPLTLHFLKVLYSLPQAHHCQSCLWSEGSLKTTVERIYSWGRINKFIGFSESEGLSPRQFHVPYQLSALALHHCQRHSACINPTAGLLRWQTSKRSVLKICKIFREKWFRFLAFFVAGLLWHYYIRSVKVTHSLYPWVCWWHWIGASHSLESLPPVSYGSFYDSIH